MKSGCKTQKGGDYTERDEKYDKKMKKKDMKSMKTAGVSNALKKSEKGKGKAKLPKVKATKKGK